MSSQGFLRPADEPVTFETRLLCCYAARVAYERRLPLACGERVTFKRVVLPCRCAALVTYEPRLLCCCAARVAYEPRLPLACGERVTLQESSASVPLRGPGHFLLLVQEKVTKEKHTLTLRFSGFLPVKSASAAGFR